VRARITFYYDVVCPWAFLASTRIESVSAAGGAALLWQPILLGGLLRALGTPEPMSTMSENKLRMGRLDLARWADHLGVALRYPAQHPRRTLEAMRLLTATSDPARRAQLSHALYRAYWQEGADVADPAVLDRIYGAPTQPVVSDPGVKDALRDATEAAAQAGLFGVPSFVCETDDGARFLFWGQDRLPFVEQVLAGWRPRSG